MSHLPTAELATLAGITVRHVQRLLAAGSVPGAERTPGGHWHIPDSKSLRRWAKDFERWNGKPIKPARRRQQVALPRVQVVAAMTTADAVKAATAAAAAARQAIAAADAQAVAAGLMLIAESERRRGRKWTEFLAEIGLHPADAREMMSIARHRRNDVDGRRLRKLGVIEKREAKATDRGGSRELANSTKWIGSAAEICGWWNRATRERPVKNWTQDERDAVRSQLRPLAEILRQL